MSLKIVAISDTHSYHRQLVVPDGDVLVHAGDLSWKGELSIIEDFADWIKGLPHKHKVIIFGNHELGFQYGPKRAKAINMIEGAGCTYLENSGAEIEGLKFWGSPVQPWFHDWEWNYQRGKDIATVWAKIPDDIDVLITHSPPYGILDTVLDGSHQGCEDLLKRIGQLSNLKAHIFGHLHLSGGMKYTAGEIIFGNAATCTESYAPTNPAIEIELFSP